MYTIRRKPLYIVREHPLWAIVQMNSTSKVVFVCSANTCRSPMAEAIAKKTLSELGVTAFSVNSAGLDASDGMPPVEEALETMRARGVDVSTHRSKRFTLSLAEGGIILTMTKKQKERILRDYPFMAGHTFTLNEFANGFDEDIPDPSTNDVSYKQCADLIERSVRRVIAKMLEDHR